MIPYLDHFYLDFVYIGHLSIDLYCYYHNLILK